MIWRSLGGLPGGRGKEENRGKGAGIEKHKAVGTKYKEVKNSIGNGEAEELI